MILGRREGIFLKVALKRKKGTYPLIFRSSIQGWEGSISGQQGTQYSQAKARLQLGHRSE